MKDQIDVTVRRSPKYSVFIAVGAILGILVSGILILTVDPASMPDGYSVAKGAGLLLVVMAVGGGFLGAIIAIILDRIGRRKARNYRVGAEVEMVDDPKEIARQRIAEMKGETPGQNPDSPEGAAGSESAEVEAGAEPDAHPESGGGEGRP